MSNGLPGFPSGILLKHETFKNWCLAIKVPKVWTCEPQNPDDVVRVCNWAAGANFQVRARGIMHTWSPITLTEGEAVSNVLLVDLTKNLNNVVSITPATGGQPAQVKAQTGITMDALMLKLQGASGGNGAAKGFSFAHIPAPGNITLGGALAINAHGTAVPTPPNDNFPISYGSLSNLILAFTAVVSDPANPSNYILKTFQRGDADARVFLTHVGRAFLIDVTMQVVDNYNLRCQSMMNITNKVLFAAQTGSNPPPQSVGDFLNKSGRIEIIWFPSFPFLGFPVPSYPWLKVWTVTAQKPAGSTEVNDPYNYPFSDNLQVEATEILSKIVSGAAALTPLFTAITASFTSSALSGGWGYKNSTDLWGPSMNTLLYVKDTTLRVTANGYAVHMQRNQVQQAIHDFTNQFDSLLVKFEKNKLYPINAPLEIRVTALDDYPPGGTQGPVISGLRYDAAGKKAGWDVACWFDVLTVQPAGDPQKANDFYEQLETWVGQRFASPEYLVMPEWSKGWAYTANDGAWTSQPYIQQIRKNFGTDPANNWEYEVNTLARYDSKGLFFNPFLKTLFTAPR
jgi:hypothetical protein